MSKNNKNEEKTTADFMSLQKEYDKELSTNVVYSLEIDPEDTYKFSDIEKGFIRYMVETNDIHKVSKILKITDLQAQNIYFKYGIKDEITRIKSAIRHKQTSRKMLTLSELGGYSSSLIMDECPEYERIDQKEKTKLMNILLKIHEMQSKIIDNPDVVDVVPESTVTDVKNCSAEELRAMLDVLKGGN